MTGQRPPTVQFTHKSHVMSITDFTEELALSYYNSEEQFPIDFENAWQWLEYSRKDSAKRAFDKSEFVEEVDYKVFHINVECADGKGFSRREEIKLSCECLKQWGMMAGTEKGKEVRMYFLNCEKIVKSLPSNYLEALKALVKTEESKLILEEKNKQLELDNQKLAEEVDDLFTFSSIIRIAKFNNCSETKFKWQDLKKKSLSLGYEVKQVPCPRFKFKNLYHHDIWKLVYPGYNLPEASLVLANNEPQDDFEFDFDLL